jgi:hypothetical protein
VGAVNRHGRKRPTLVLTGGNNERAASFISSQLREILNLNVVDGQRGEQGHAPRAGLGTACGVTLLATFLGEFGMGVKVETPVTTQQAMYGVPSPTTRLLGHPNAGGELDKLTLQMESFLKQRELILGVTAPQFLYEEQIGLEF